MNQHNSRIGPIFALTLWMPSLKQFSKFFESVLLSKFSTEKRKLGNKPDQIVLSIQLDPPDQSQPIHKGYQISKISIAIIPANCQKCQNNLVRIVIRGAHADCRERGCIISYRCLLLNQSKLWCTPSTHNTQSFNNKLANQTWAIQNDHFQCPEKGPFIKLIP